MLSYVCYGSIFENTRPIGKEVPKLFVQSDLKFVLPEIKVSVNVS